jgi:signal transduction histidine kinase
LTLDRQPVDLAALAEKCLTLMTPQAVRQRISIDVVDRGGPNIVLGDEVRLTQILTNLINNAVKSSPEGGRIRIKISPAGTAEIALRVIDKGCGIPKSELANVTEPFRQAGTYQTRFNPYSSENSGTGLGLAIVKRLTEAHGGRLGTIVEVVLPRHEDARSEPAPEKRVATN